MTAHIGDLKPDKNNARRHGERNISLISRSLESDGFGRSILLDAGGNIITGNGVTEAAGNVGIEDVLIVPSDGTRVIAIQRTDVEPGSERAVRLAIADNRANELSDFDPAVVAALADEVDLSDFWRDDELDALLAGIETDAVPVGDDPGAPMDRAGELQSKWQVERGQLYEIGRHRLLCGDSTDAGDVTTLFASVTPNIAILDPPYGMRLDADFSDMKTNSRFFIEKKLSGGTRYDNVAGDHEDFDASHVALLLRPIKEQFWFGADYYAATLGDTMHGGSWFVWDKRVDETFDKMFGSCFELIWSRQRHQRDILRCRWAGPFGTEQEPEHSRSHPTQKPTALFTDILERYSADGAVVADLYAGAGGVMVAAEQSGRTAYCCEMLPKYCAVILERMSGMGLTPRLVARDGGTTE